MKRRRASRKARIKTHSRKPRLTSARNLGENLSWRAYLDEAADFIITLDALGTITYVNRAVCETTGYSSEELLGKNAFEFIPSESHLLAESELKRLLSGESVDPVELEVLSKDGRHIVLEVLGRALRDKSQIAGTLHIARNISERKRAEQALLLQGEIAANMFEGVVLTRASDGAIVYANRRFEEMLGYGPGELIDRSIAVVNAPSDRSTSGDISSEIQNNLKQTGTWSGEVLSVRKDGTRVWCRANVSTLESSNYGKIWVATHEDITERKQAEIALRESEARYRTLFENANDALFFLDAKGGFLDFNNVACERLGYSREELAKMTIKDVTSESSASIPQYVEETQLRGRTVFEAQEVRRDGSVLPVEVSVRGISYMGEPAVLAISRDITERKGMEERLRESEERHRLLIERQREGLGISDLDERFVFCNPAGEEIFGVPPGALVGRNLREFTTPETFKIVRKETQIRVAGKTSTYGLEIIRPDGEKRQLLITSTPWRDKDGRIVGSTAIFRDESERKRMEEKLRESEKRYSSLFDRIVDGVYLSTHQGRFVDVNPAFVKMFGYSSKQEMLDIPDISKALYFSPEERNVPENAQKGVEVYPMRRKDGSEVWVEDHGDFIRDEYGKITYHEGILRDVTERRRAEELLRASELKYRWLFEQIPHAIYQTSPDGRLLTANPAFARLFGYDSGKELTAVDVERDFYVNPEERKRWTEIMEEQGEIRDVELHLKRKNGEEINVLDRAHAVRDAQGTIMYYEGTLTDITQRKRMEEEIKRYSGHLEELVQERTGALQESERKYRHLVETAQEGLFTYDTNGVVTFVNPHMSTMLGYVREHIIGKSILAFVDEEDIGRVKAGMEKRRRGIGETYDVRLIRKDGTRMYVSATASPVTSKDGEYAGGLVLLTDISERKEMERRLQQAERLAAVGETAAMVGHDLRNPLQGIAGAVYLLRNGSLTPDERNKMLQLIENNVEYSDGIVRDLLDYSRTFDLALTETTLEEIITSALRAAQVPDKIKVEILSPDRRILTLDMERMKRVFINLIENAVDAMPTGGTLTVSSTQLNGSLEISISDTGIGLSQSVAENPWKPLQTTKAKGLGMGLAICKRIVDAHGGEMSVQSKKDVGTTFTIRIPIKPKAASRT